MPNAADAMTAAVERTRRILFDPFDLAKYVGLGFCVWLTQLGNVSASWGSRFRGGAGGDPFDADLWAEIGRVVTEWGGVLVVAGGAATLLAAAVWTLLLFLQCRGLFMTIDGIVRDRGAIAEPWAAYAPEADALFRFRLTLALVVLVVATLVTASAGLVWWRDPTFSGLPAATVGLGGLVLLVVAVLRGIADACATEFVAPMMYARRYGVRAGFADLRVAVSRDPGSFVLYVLIRMFVALFATLVAATLVCVTCGVALLPFVGTLILLPLLVFVRSYALQFVAQQAEDLAVALTPAG